jgi:hypothetical protein
MTDRDLLPASFTAPIAARLLKTTPSLLAELTAAGAIAAMPGENWRHYSRDEIERVLGRQLIIQEYLAAERAHDRRREVNQRYNAKRSGGRTLLRVPAKGAA